MLETIKRKRLQKPNLEEFQSPYSTEIYWYGDYIFTSYTDQISKLGVPRLTKKMKEFPQFFKISKRIPIIKHNALGVDYNLIHCPIGTFNFSLNVKKGSNWLQQEDYVAEIEKHFLLGETEVTRELYYTVMGLKDDPKYTWYDPQSPVFDEKIINYLFFCNKLSELENLQACYTFELVDEEFWGEMIKSYTFHFDPSKNGYRLPSSKEWQYAAKAGTENEWSGTNDPKKLKDYAIISTKNDNPYKPQIVKQRKPNEWGFYDMTGNVQELVSNSTTKISRVHGGHYLCTHDSQTLRSSTRIEAANLDKVGFRIARTLG